MATLRPIAAAAGLFIASCTGRAPSCARHDASARRAVTPDATGSPPIAGTSSEPTDTAEAPTIRPAVDGRSFPDKVIALTWDDGPDANTLALARYLKSRKVSATFFVVGAWIDGVSSDPGRGKGVFTTGYAHLPILGDLVTLGHRLGNHTLNHVVLREDVGRASLDHQLRDNQRAIDPFLLDELRIFRAPGGGWGSAASDVVERDPYLASMVGPIRWDIDGEDWDASLECLPPVRESECEKAGPGGTRRLKPAAAAQRYVATIDAIGHGIVLLHDRVGHVGSTYALDLAHAMIPQLQARGYVFAAPILRFSPLSVRLPDSPKDASGPQHWEAASIRLADVNGDGRADLCGRSTSGIQCALSVPITAFHLPHAAFRLEPASDAKALRIGPRPEARTPATTFTDRDGDRTLDTTTLRIGDLNGDGRADVCGRSERGIVCAFSTGRDFTKPTTWITADVVAAQGWNTPERASTIQLGDVNGDGRADICGRGEGGIVCAMAP